MNMRQVCRVGGMVVMMGLLATALWGCAPAPSATDEGFPELHAAPLAEDEKLRVVATTSLVADVVKQVGGERLELYTLVPLGADPHAFVPAPQDAAAVANAQVIFINGAGLETFMEPLLESAGTEVPVVSVSYGIPLLEGPAHDEDVAEEAEDAHHHEEGDPHMWFSPRNVKVWVQNIERALSALDPASADFYAANAAAYTRELEALDLWIQEQVAQIPPANRKLVTDHTVFTYFAAAYGFEQVGAIFPGYSTVAAPSAQELAQLEDAIRQFAVPAIFVGLTVNPAVAEQVAQDTGVRVVMIYHGSLSEAGGPADSYLKFMRYNVNAIVEALR